VDVGLEKEEGKEELAKIKKESPPNKSPLFKILGDIGNNGEGGEESINNMGLDAIGCTANVVMVD